MNNFTFAFMVLMIVLVILLAIYSTLFLCYLLAWRKIPETSIDIESYPFFSVIIPARNEAEHIAQTLESILKNNYPASAFEVILIDDYSEDNTVSIAKKVLDRYPQVQTSILSLSQFFGAAPQLNSYKKKALETAITSAGGTHIITTDADCIVPPNWLKSFAAAYRHGDVKFVIAPVNFVPAAQTDTLYYFQSIDFLTMQGITAASYQLGWGKMCNGANLSFSKKAFDAVGGYSGIDHKASGDDMMLLHKISKHFPESIKYLKSTESIVHTPVQASWSGFWNQRIRWASKNGTYNDTALNINLMLVYLFNLILLISVLYAVVVPQYWVYILFVLLMKIIIEQSFIRAVSKFYKKNEYIYHVILQPLHIFYIVAVGFLGAFGSYKWKGRVVK